MIAFMSQVGEGKQCFYHSMSSLSPPSSFQEDVPSSFEPQFYRTAVPPGGGKSVGPKVYKKLLFQAPSYTSLYERTDVPILDVLCFQWSSANFCDSFTDLLVFTFCDLFC